MNTWLSKLKKIWQRVFFWQQNGSASQEIKPHAHTDHALVLQVTQPARFPRFRQLRFINRVLSAQEKRLFWGAALVFFGACVFGTVDLAATRVVPVPGVGGTYTEGIVGAPKLINPLYSSLNDVDRDLVSLVYSGLFRMNEQLEAVPDLAERYLWSDDGKTLEVTLRKNARFHDGTPMTSDDVYFTYQLLKNPITRSPLAGQFRDVQVIQIDEQTIQFQLSNPDPSFLTYLSIGILPMHIWEEIPIANMSLADANLKPIGSGPYQVATFTRDNRGQILHYNLKRFDSYYGIKPLIEEVRLRFFTDRPSAENAFRNGQIDALAFVPWTEGQVLSGEQYLLHRIELPQVTVAFFNTKHPLLKDVRLREALSLAVDSQELATIVGDHVFPVTSPYPFLAYTTSTESSLDLARTRLDAIGWRLPENGLVRQFVGGNRSTTTTSSTTSSTTSTSVLSLSILVPNQPDLLKVADALKRRWSLSGAEVNILSDEPENLLRNALEKRDYQILLTNILLSPNQDLTPFWSSANTSGNGLNLSNLSDRDVDLALTRVSSATSTEALQTSRIAFTEVLNTKKPALFLLRPIYGYLVSKRIQGTGDVRVLKPADRFLYLKNWYIRTTWGWR